MPPTHPLAHLTAPSPQPPHLTRAPACPLPCWNLAIFALVLTCTLVMPKAARAQWTNVTTPELADTTWALDKKGVAFVDFDGDGDLDICAVGEGLRPGEFFRNDGAGVWTDVTPAALFNSGSGSGQTWGDYDNDGDLDLFISLEEEPMRLLRNDGGGVFTNITSGTLLEVAHGHSTTWIDYDRDGLLDLYVAYFHQPSKLLRNTGTALVDVTTDSLGVSNNDGIAWGDFDNDGDPDAYLIRFLNSPSVFMRNDGAAGFTNITTPALANTINGHSGASADYDNDGDLDIYTALANYPNHLLRNSFGTFEDVTPANLALGAHSVGVCWADFDNDGWVDLFVSTTQLGVNHMFHNNGNGTFTEITAGPLVGTGTNAGIAAGDFDDDGDLDLYVSSYLSRPNLLLRNDIANGNHWIELDLQGTLSNRSALGARVWLTAGGMTQMREVSGCTGYRSQSALTVHFGLGASTQVDRIRIRWPSGVVQDTLLTSVDHRFKMVENPSLLGVPVGATGGRRITFAAPVPNPTPDVAQLAFTLPVASAGRLAIVDTQGRTIRVLEQGPLSAGPHRVNWDGLDDRGARPSGGMYWCVLEAAGERVSRRLAVVR